MKPIRTIIVCLVVALLGSSTFAANVLCYVGPSGQTGLYVRVNMNGTQVYYALTEGTGGSKGEYYVTDTNLVNAGLNTASSGNGFLAKTMVGTASGTADDPIIAFRDLPWSGSAEVAQVAAIKAKTDQLAFSTTDLGDLLNVNTLTIGGTGQNNGNYGDKLDTINNKIGTPADTLAADIAAGGGGTPAQVHNEKPVPAFTAKLGTRADGVIRAYPAINVTATTEGHIWIECSKLLSDNVENVTDEESSDEDVATITSVGPYEKFVSIKFDSSGATAGDTATFTCTVPKIGPVAVDIVVKAP